MPSFLYYLGLYLIIIFTNYFRLKGEHSNDVTPVQKFPWKKIFFVSNEIIYTGSGVYIALLANHIWVGPIMVALILLIVISLYMIAMESKFSNNVKFVTHVMIIGVVVAATFFFFSRSTEDPNRTKTYKVICPYFDKSVVKKLGYDRFSETYFSYTTMVQAKSDSEAREHAMSKFWKDSTLQPMFSTKENMTKQQLLKIDNNNILAKQLN